MRIFFFRYTLTLFTPDVFTLLRVCMHACMHNKDYATQIKVNKVKNEIFLQRRENQIESFCACPYPTYCVKILRLLDFQILMTGFFIILFVTLLSQSRIICLISKKHCRGCCPKCATELNIINSHSSKSMQVSD